jgi:hypothetical protein
MVKIGERIEIPVHYDLWMQGARTGRVVGYRGGKPGQSDYFLVRMDSPHVAKPIRLWGHDAPYAKRLSCRQEPVT